jgi:hypothetical protein
VVGLGQRSYDCHGPRIWFRGIQETVFSLFCFCTTIFLANQNEARSLCPQMSPRLLNMLLM